jgi:type IX secretion system PorP/SprF family membrane protein
MVRKLIFVSLCLSLWTTYSVLSAQDFHYSQFTNGPLHLNPGLTGVFGGQTRINTNFRSQWEQVPVSYRTFSVTADHKYNCGNQGPGFFSTGIALNYDRAGDSRLTLANVGLYGSYTHPLSQQTFLTGGMSMGLGQRSFDTDDLRFDSQFDPLMGIFSENLSNMEEFAQSSHLFADFGFGLNFRWQALNRGTLIDLLQKRSKLDVGVGVHHLNRPDMSFVDGIKDRLPMRISTYAAANIQVLDPLDLRLAFTAQFQQAYREYVGQAGVNIFGNRQPGQQWSLLLAVGLRFNDFNDAWFPALELNYHETIKAAVSYDFNISDFERATNSRGGLELNIRYLIRKVCPLPDFKFCPLI